jgi:DNA-binding MarR family transcriptional regulator
MPTNGSRAFRGFITLLQSQKPWLNERVSALGITSQMSQALYVLHEHPDVTMRAFAEQMFCDASNATGILDRLEQRGLAERRAAESDRRAKVVRLTPAGQRMHKRIDEAILAEAPPAIAKLSAADQRALREIIERALENVEAETD